jgi:tripartite-type tricarboxylate transporter receptor subunit TctC
MRNWWNLYVTLALTGCWLVAGTQAALAQAFPAKPIRLVAPFSAGGGGDTVARLVAQKLTDVFGQQVIVDNRAGANNIIGTEAVARAAPDGYTILIVNNSHASNTYLFRKLPYDAVGDFAPISLVALTPFMLVVHPSLPVKSVRDLIELARARPGQLNYASAGIGSVAHFAAELFRINAKVNIVHIPYKGVTGAVIDTMAGAAQMMIVSPITVLPQVKAGKLRALAVTTAARSRALPDLPTLQESGVAGYEFSSCYGLLAPRGVPGPVLASLNQAVSRVLQQKDLQDRLASEAAEPAGGTPEQFGEYLKQQGDKFAKLIKAIGLKPE